MKRCCHCHRSIPEEQVQCSDKVDCLQQRLADDERLSAELRRQLAAAQASVKELEEALRPFADVPYQFGKDAERVIPHRVSRPEAYPDCRLTIGDFRRAKAALEGKACPTPKPTTDKPSRQL